MAAACCRRSDCGVERGVQSLGALDLLLRARDFFLALLELESGLLELRS